MPAIHAVPSFDDLPAVVELNQNLDREYYLTGTADRNLCDPLHLIGLLPCCCPFGTSLGSRVWTHDRAANLLTAAGAHFSHRVINYIGTVVELIEKPGHVHARNLIDDLEEIFRDGVPEFPAVVVSGEYLSVCLPSQKSLQRPVHQFGLVVCVTSVSESRFQITRDVEGHHLGYAPVAGCCRPLEGDLHLFQNDGEVEDCNRFVIVTIRDFLHTRFTVRIESLVEPGIHRFVVSHDTVPVLMAEFVNRNALRSQHSFSGKERGTSGKEGGILHSTCARIECGINYRRCRIGIGSEPFAVISDAVSGCLQVTILQTLVFGAEKEGYLGGVAGQEFIFFGKHQVLGPGGPGKIVDHLLAESVRGRPILLYIGSSYQHAGCTDHAIAGDVQPDIVGSVIGEILDRKVLVCFPAVVCQDSDLWKPLGHEVVVADVAGTGNGSGHLGREIDPETYLPSGGKGAGKLHAEQSLIVFIAVVGLYVGKCFQDIFPGKEHVCLDLDACDLEPGKPFFRIVGRYFPVVQSEPCASVGFPCVVIGMEPQFGDGVGGCIAERDYFVTGNCMCFPVEFHVYLVGCHRSETGFRNSHPRRKLCHGS